MPRATVRGKGAERRMTAANRNSEWSNDVCMRMGRTTGDREDDTCGSLAIRPGSIEGVVKVVYSLNININDLEVDTLLLLAATI